MTSRSRSRQRLVVLDVEGVLTPEVWVAVAEHCGIDYLRRTTRDEPDYDLLMRGRLDVLVDHGVTYSTIMDVVAGLEPLAGAAGFLDELRSRTQVVLLSDTFEPFGRPLMAQLGWPTLLCHDLVVDDDFIVDYRLRIPDQKAAAVRAFQGLNYRVVAAGDSFNDVSMLAAADTGILFRAAGHLVTKLPQYPACESYEGLLAVLTEAVESPPRGC